MGLRHCLPDIPSPRRRPAWLAAQIQLAPPTRHLKSKPPISRLALTEDNLLRLHTWDNATGGLFR